MTEIAAAGGEKLTWTDERVEMLKKMWAEGLSASQIAAKISGGVTRNAVIGKVHRLGLAGRQTTPRAPSTRTTQRKDRAPGMAPTRMPSQPSMPTAGANALKFATQPHHTPKVAPLPEPKPLRLVDLPRDGRITIFHLSDKTCKWPIGDPMHDDFCFCGHGPREGSPYCEYHARIAYQPAQDRRMRRAG
jgi:GcrA cell cycle regulator